MLTKGFYKIIKSYWQVGLPVLIIFLLFEAIKPGLAMSHLNFNVIIISIFVTWLFDVLRPVEKFRK